MDTTDPTITFDENGVCSHCHRFDTVMRPMWFPNEEGLRRLQRIVEKIKKEGEGKPYDSIIGLSGGVDSSYLALKVKEYGLRPLVVHVDAGWNSELAVYNIEKVVDYCGYDLHTHVVDWEEMKDLQLAYLRSGIANQDVPQDHAFFASLYHFAVKNGIRYVLSGGNIATEGIFPSSWHYTAMDARNLRAIHRRYGTRPLKRYKTISFFEYYFYYPYIKKMQVVRPLNFMPYIKEDAIRELEEKVGYKRYVGKHGESLFTAFFQEYYLPVKFGYDKRRPHLSSLIVSGQLSREAALEELEKPPYNEESVREMKTYFVKKLGITLETFDQILAMPSHTYADFPNNERLYTLMKKVQTYMEKRLKRGMARYS
jgi:N-acetyl sugar amidotransferase